MKLNTTGPENGMDTRHPTLIQRLYWLKRWMYRGGRPRRLARALNRLWATAFSSGRLSPDNAMTLEVRGRRSGLTIAFPVVVAAHEDQRYVVSMLGENANWVRNVRAAHGHATLRRKGTEAVRLVEVPGRSVQVGPLPIRA